MGCGNELPLTLGAWLRLLPRAQQGPHHSALVADTVLSCAGTSQSRAGSQCSACASWSEACRSEQGSLQQKLPPSTGQAARVGTHAKHFIYIISTVLLRSLGDGPCYSSCPVDVDAGLERP